MNTLKEGLKHWIRRMIRFVGETSADPFAATTPVNPLSSDVYLVTYPKSGTAWLGFLLGNVNLLMSGIDRRMTFFDCEDVIPTLATSRHIPQVSTSFPGFRMIHSHSSYNPNYKNVILLVRNPVDVMASYYDFTVQLGAFSGDIQQFIDDPAYGIASWTSHTAGWLDSARAGYHRGSMCVIKYEELRGDPAAVIHEVYRLFGFELPDTVVATAIERSSLAAMKAEEKRFNARNPGWIGFEHVRKQAAGGPRVAMDGDLVGKVEMLARPVLERLGYATR